MNHSLGINRKLFKIISISGFILLVILIGLRLYLPTFLLHFAETTLNQIPEYSAHIEDIDVHLWKGSYTIKGLELHKIKKNIPVAFFSAKKIDLSLEWAALLQGRLVAKIITYHPSVNFVTDEKGNNEQLSINEQWVTIVKNLFPLNINSIQIINGQIHYRSYTSEPSFDVSLKNIQGKIKNLQKVKHGEGKNSLVSVFKFKANERKGGSFDLKGKFDPFAKQPTFYLAADLKNLQLNTINNFINSLLSVNVKKGVFSLYAEIAAKEGKISGYVKPFIKDLAVASPHPKNPLSQLYTGIVDLASNIVTNSKQDTIATKIEITGDINNPDTHILSILSWLFSHAFINGLVPQLDHSVKMQNISHNF